MQTKKRKIEDYIHLYLGCDVLVKYTDNKIEERRKLSAFGLTCLLNNDSFIEYYKPILRSPASLTDDEAIHIANIIQPQLDSVKWKVKKTYSRNSEVLTSFICYRKYYQNEIVIDAFWNEVECYTKESLDGEEHKTPLIDVYPHQHEVTKYLLSIGMDLYDLIKDGLAIDKSTIPQPQEHEKVD